MQDVLTPPAASSRIQAVTRLRAAGIHLLLSAIVAGLAALLVFGLWYPSPFREISGGRELFFIIIAVDVVLGPLITFFIFDRRKPRSELRRDLALVGLLQVAGLVFGLHTVFIARPVVLAAEGRRLRVVRAVDVDDAALAKAPPALQRLPWHGIQVVATRMPQGKEQAEAIDLALQGLDVGMRPELWLPPESAHAALQAAALPLLELQQRRPNQAALLAGHAARTGLGVEQLKYLPMIARRTDWIALIDGSSGRIVGYAPVDGF